MSLINFYTHIKKKTTSYNPNFKKHGINVPFRILIAGSSSSMKTNTSLNILKQMNGTFEKVIVVCKCKNEPLYEMLAEKLGDLIEFYENGVIPPLDKFTGKEQIVVIFDDLMTMKNQNQIVEYFIRSRKKNISCMYLTQSYYKAPKSVRINCNYIILKKLSSKKDLKSVLDDNALGVDLKELEKIYSYATKDKLNFLMIDVDNEPHLKFRINFTPIR